MANIEQRLEALETEVQQLREQLTDTHTLAAHADRDVAEFRSELRAQTQLINFTRQDLNDLREEMTGDLNNLREEMTNGFAEMRAGFAALTQLLTPDTNGE